ncbi:hypothetical protein E1295_03740 [Nonomuraea mesophila]|uniref:Uncharacterized protein n=1 Tax=Nonomuraea mesophila TaxID=2530382 RepID=A0A4R5FW39_9ACTN|nr:YwqJ-related putative deaminase [Nonomuraea mesophila]TDE59029.1 hypothetical protein E1295_03740 [Nonomuraea mesophila]
MTAVTDDPAIAADFGLLGLPSIPDPSPAYRQAETLQAVADHYTRLAGDGAAASCRAALNQGPAADAADRHVNGPGGALPQTSGLAGHFGLVAGLHNSAAQFVQHGKTRLAAYAAAAAALALAVPQVRAWVRARALRLYQQFRAVLAKFGDLYRKLLARVASGTARTGGGVPAVRAGAERATALSARERQAGRLQPPGPLERDMPLPRPADLRFERDQQGLIVAVNGRPVREFVGDLTLTRSSEYLARREAARDLAFSRAKAGPVYTLLMDRRTGRLYEGLNDMLRRVPDDLHPLLRERYDKFSHWARRNGPFQHDEGWPPGGFPHWSEPGTHSEVTATSKALWDRTRDGETVTAGTLREFHFDNRLLSEHYQGITARQRIPCCANCTNFLYDTPNSVGYFTRYPSAGQSPLTEFTPPWAT